MIYLTQRRQIILEALDKGNLSLDEAVITLKSLSTRLGRRRQLERF